jgi:hypothetical protein
MHAPASRHLDLYKYWLWKRRALIMPVRSDIDPTDIPQLLPYLLIAEKAGDQFRYRLVGSAVVRAVGYHATGTTAGSYLTSPGDAAEVRSIFRRVFTGACPVYAAGEFVFKTGARPQHVYADLAAFRGWIDSKHVHLYASCTLHWLAAGKTRLAQWFTR